MAFVVIFGLNYYAYTQSVVTKKHIAFDWTFAAIVPKPLAVAFALFFCLVRVLPSPKDANAGAAASVAITNVAATNMAISPRVVCFI